jgi:hypothetical protein
MLIPLFVASCGSSGGDSAEAPATEQTMDESSIVAGDDQVPIEVPSPSSPYKQGPVHFTTPSGWEYDLDTFLEAPTVAFEKDVQTSPPGQAKIIATVSGAANSTATVSGTIPGRTAPELAAQISWLMLTPDGGTIDLDGGCTPMQPFFTQYVASAFNKKDGTFGGFECQDGSGVTSDYPESVIDPLLPRMQQDSTTLVAFVKVGYENLAGGVASAHYDCAVLYYPNGERVDGASLKAGKCGDVPG